MQERMVGHLVAGKSNISALFFGERVVVGNYHIGEREMRSLFEESGWWWGTTVCREEEKYIKGALFTRGRVVVGNYRMQRRRKVH